MRTPNPYGARVAKRLFLSYTIPLIVLTIAGIVLPLFVWTWLDNYRLRFENEAELSQRASSLRQTALELGEIKTESSRIQTDSSRRDLQRARDRYRSAAIRFRDWLESHPDSERSRLYRTADQNLRNWLRFPIPPPGFFESTRDAFDHLVEVSNIRRDERRDQFRQMDALRRSAVVAIPVAAIALALLIGRSVAVSLTRPLVELTRAAIRIRSGGTQRELDPSHDPADEIGDLRRAFRSMSDAILRRENELNSRNTALTAVGKRLEAVLNATDEGIAMLDRNGRFSVVNERFGELMGIPPQNLLATHVADMAPRLLLRFKDSTSARRELRRIARTPDAVWSESFALVGERPQMVRIYTAPVLSNDSLLPGEQRMGRIVVLRDITHESEVDRMKTEFVSTVSHELRTPLTAIKGYVDLILGGQTGPLTETQVEFLHLAAENTERLTALINDILDISRIEQGGGSLRQASMNYPPVVQHVRKLLAGQAQDRGVDLTVEFDLPDCRVEGDRDRIVQVLSNLVSNGLKYTPRGGQVRVRVRAEPDFVRTEVLDNGIGISESDRKHIFERFYRADNSSTRSVGGTGLGLAITKALVERMGGSLTCESQMGVGSTFAFTLPRTDSHEEDSDWEINGLSFLVLLLDSSSESRTRLANHLRRHRYAVSLAADEVEALRRFRGLRPDAVLVDPTDTGFDVPSLLAKMATAQWAKHCQFVVKGSLDNAFVLQSGDKTPEYIASILRNPECRVLNFSESERAGLIPEPCAASVRSVSGIALPADFAEDKPDLLWVPFKRESLEAYAVFADALPWVHHSRTVLACPETFPLVPLSEPNGTHVANERVARQLLELLQRTT